MRAVVLRRRAASRNPRADRPVATAFDTRSNHRVLPDQLIERRGPVFAGQDAVRSRAGQISPNARPGAGSFVHIAWPLLCGIPAVTIPSRWEADERPNRAVGYFLPDLTRLASGSSTANPGLISAAGRQKASHAETLRAPYRSFASSDMRGFPLRRASCRPLPYRPSPASSMAEADRTRQRYAMMAALTALQKARTPAPM
jgi:hypothetical protein